MRELILHVGYPKTGTTTLQGALFETLTGLDYVGKCVTGGPEQAFRAPWVDRFRTMVNFGISPHVEAARDALSAAIGESLSAAPERRVLISLEGLTNPLVDTRSTQAKDLLSKAEHIRLILAPLIEAGVAVRILVTLRAQTRLIPSLFSQIYLQGVSSGLFGRSYDAFLDFLFDDDVEGLGPMFRYDLVVDRYAALFGAENVVAFRMEDLLGGGETESLARLSAMLGLAPEETAARLGGSRLNVHRRVVGAATQYKMMTGSPAARRFAGLIGLPVDRAGFGLAERARIAMGRDVYRSLPDRGSRIAAYYAPSNARLAATYGVDLGDGV